MLFVGRITRQKGIVHLVRAIEHLAPGFQVVLCAGAPDTPEIAAEMKARWRLRRRGDRAVVWIEQMVSTPEKIELYSSRGGVLLPVDLRAVWDHQSGGDGLRDGGRGECGGRHQGSRAWRRETGLLVPLEQMRESPFEAVDPANGSRRIWRRGSMS